MSYYATHSVEMLLGAEAVVLTVGEWPEESSASSSMPTTQRFLRVKLNAAAAKDNGLVPSLHALVDTYEWCNSFEGRYYHVGQDAALCLSPPAPSKFHLWDFVATQWVDSRTLQDLKAIKWQQIKQARDKQEVSGFPYLGTQIDSDSRSVQRITTAVQSADAAQRAGVAFAIEWTCADNTSLALDGPGMQGMPVALAYYANGLHERARDLRTQINSVTSPEQLALINWSIE